MMSHPRRKRVVPTVDAHVPAAEPFSAARQQRYEEAAALLRLWMDAEDGYDAEIWPLVEEELQIAQRRSR
jgi:hypothetical protein